MTTQPPIDPAIVAYLGGAMALIKLWHNVSQQAASSFRADAAEAEELTSAPQMEQLMAIRATAARLLVPAACQAVQQAFLAAMDQGLAAYQALLEPDARDEQKVAMLSGVENFAYLDAELARLEQQVGPFELE